MEGRWGTGFTLQHQYCTFGQKLERHKSIKTYMVPLLTCKSCDDNWNDTWGIVLETSAGCSRLNLEGNPDNHLSWKTTWNYVHFAQCVVVTTVSRFICIPKNERAADILKSFVHPFPPSLLVHLNQLTTQNSTSKFQSFHKDSKLSLAKLQT